jgi:hypothetical protein
MLQWKHLLITSSVGLLYISNPVSARFLSVDPVTAQQHIQNGNIQGFNRYAYVNNNPYRYTDPDGRILMPVGNQKDVTRINNMLNKIEKSSPVLAGKIDQLRQSKNPHFIGQVEQGKNPGNSPLDGSGNDFNKVGMGSETNIDLNKSFTKADGSFTSSPEAVLAHELAGHAADVDKGVAGNPKDSVAVTKSENNAMKMGNIYREANNEPLRKEY